MQYCERDAAGVITGGTGCLALTGGSFMDNFGIVLAGISLIFLGVMLYLLVKRGTRIPVLKKLFPKNQGSQPPLSERVKNENQ